MEDIFSGGMPHASQKLIFRIPWVKLLLFGRRQTISRTGLYSIVKKKKNHTVKYMRGYIHAHHIQKKNKKHNRGKNGRNIKTTEAKWVIINVRMSYRREKKRKLKQKLSISKS